MTISEKELTIAPQEYSLLTDLYELTMIACYAGENIATKPASFELFVRHLPEGFGYLIAMGLEQVLEYLERLSFSEVQIEALKEIGIFDNAPAEFWSLLRAGTFTGDVWAVPEGTAIFANEPFLRIDAPLWQAQLVETYILNTINYQTLIATKAAKMRDMAGERTSLLEFGTRRAFSPQGAIWAARAALAAGFNSTSNVLAALKLGEKPTGTMAHALIMAIDAIAGNEDAAFEAFLKYFPTAPLLIDTYDTVAAAERLRERVAANEMKVTGVRLDSGDLAELSQKVRSQLPDINIFVSGDIGEAEIARLQKEGAAIDGYGVGTKLVTGKPVNGVYKLVDIDNIPTMKQSSSKATYPGRKQIFRTIKEGCLQRERLGLADETANNGEQSLLQLMMQNGKRKLNSETLDTIRQRTAKSVTSLPSATRQIDNPTPVEVEISNALESLRIEVEKRLSKNSTMNN
ncbi:nicotinate phosphoribosyltransferase [Myxosarcina sp. GI1]|uniref:nicotinate phosphoribosyltransferase n=1 Tax=Myxosarcina sp. GI1 TaxID=1541065 RepID=UPI000566AE30|nr:nicotinate phosphoribosyltransferase [Myxosarcina sp. GI1]